MNVELLGSVRRTPSQTENITLINPISFIFNQKFKCNCEFFL